MAIYRFRISFEDYDEVIREIDMLSKHTFLDLHNAIQNANGYNPEVPSSFYRSNDQWKKGEEIAYLPSSSKQSQDVKLMETAKLNQYINDPHQKFYYTYNFERPVFFHVQLIKIAKEEDGKTYPVVFKSIGQSPKLAATGTIPPTEEKESETYALFNEMDYEADDADNMDVDADEDTLDTNDFDEEQNFEDDL